MPEAAATGRFAPSATGRAHPGTLFAALLCWLDARAAGARIVLRLEDLDPERCRDEYRTGLREDLDWFGLDWDLLETQSAQGDRHRAALARLAAAGCLYPCSCSRTALRAAGRSAADGGWVYPGTCRGRVLTDLDCGEPLRCRMPVGWQELRDGSGRDLGQDVAAEMGDPVLRRRDGAIAYHLASVVDDAAVGVTRVVRGADLVASTATQVALQGLLGLPTPSYRHHPLLLEERPAGTAGQAKFAKLHGAVAAPELRRHYAAEELCGLLAWVAGLLDRPEPCRPQDLVAGFTWQKVRGDDAVLRWDGRSLSVVQKPTEGPLQSWSWLTPAVPAAVSLVTCPATPALLDRPAPEPGRAGLRHLLAADGAVADEVVVQVCAEDRWELGCHGGPAVRTAVTAALASHGLQEVPLPTVTDRWARLARAPSPAAVSWLLRHGKSAPPFAPEFLERIPLVLITGPVNAGKSTLLNAWCGHSRALVSDIPGTTRDLLAAETEVGGWRLRLIDSAGLRVTTDTIEQAGQDLVARMREQADLVLYLLPPSGGEPEPGDLVVHGKADLIPPPAGALAWSSPAQVGEAAAAEFLRAIGAAVLARLRLSAVEPAGSNSVR